MLSPAPAHTRTAGLPPQDFDCRSHRCTGCWRCGGDVRDRDGCRSSSEWILEIRFHPNLGSVLLLSQGVAFIIDCSQASFIQSFGVSESTTVVSTSLSSPMATLDNHRTCLPAEAAPSVAASASAPGPHPCVGGKRETVGAAAAATASTASLFAPGMCLRNYGSS